MKIIVCFFIFCVACNCQNVNFSMSPVYVTRGEDATIPCSYTTDITGVPTIKWYRQRGNSQQLIYTYKRGDNAITAQNPAVKEDNLMVNNDGSLVIYDVEISDDKAFKNLRCDVDFGQKGHGSGDTTFTVVVLPEKEPVVKLDRDSFPSQDNIPLGSCETDYAYPEPIVTLYKGGEDDASIGDQDLTRASDNSDYEDDFGGDFLEDILIIEDQKSGLLKVKKSLVSSLNKSDDRAKFRCVVKSGGGGEETSRTQEVRFPEVRVIYATDMVEFVRRPEYVVDGDDLELACEANGYPDATILMDGREQSSMKLKVNKKDDNRTITCRAFNSRDVSPVSTSYTMKVIYADPLKIEGDNEKVPYGGSLSLMCMGDSRPEAKRTFWKKDGKDVSQTGDYTKQEVNFDDSGVYTCVAENRYERLTRRQNSKTIHVVGLVVQNGAKSVEVEGKVGEKSELSCMIDANPKPNVVWTRKAVGSESKEESVDGAELRTKPNNHYVSVLTLDSLEPAMSQMEYKCSVTSGENQQMVTFNLPELKQKPTDTNKNELIQASSSTTIIIILVLVGIIVIAIVLLLLYRKGIICSKKDEDGGDEDAKDISMKIHQQDAEVGQNKNEYLETSQNETTSEQQPNAESDALINGTGEHQ